MKKSEEFSREDHTGKLLGLSAKTPVPSFDGNSTQGLLREIMGETAEQEDTVYTVARPDSISHLGVNARLEGYTRDSELRNIKNESQRRIAEQSSPGSGFEQEMRVDEYIERTIEGGISELVRKIKQFENDNYTIPVLEILKIIFNTDFNPMILNTFHRMGFVFSLTEIEEYVDDIGLAKLKTEGLVDNERSRLNVSSGQEHRVGLRSVGIVRRANNLLGYSKILRKMDGEIMEWKTYLFRVINENPRLVKVERSRKTIDEIEKETQFVISEENLRGIDLADFIKEQLTPHVVHTKERQKPTALGLHNQDR